MPTAELSLQIEGMTCGSCVSHVDKALRSVAGVTSAAVNLTTGTATVNGSPIESQLITAVEHAGYKARVLENLSAKTLRDIEKEGESNEAHVRSRLTVGAIAGLAVVLIDIFSPRLHVIHSPQGLLALSIAQALLATVVLLYTGLPFFTGAFRALRHAATNMDVLVALGSGVAYVYSIIVLISEFAGAVEPHALHLEFHAAVAIIVLVTLGKYLEARAKKRASSAVANLASQSSPTATRILSDGSLETIPAEQIKIGDTLQILAHQQLPVDGYLLDGAGSLDLSIITGESLPVELTPPTPPAPPSPAPPPQKKSLSLTVLSSPIENRKSKIENSSPPLPGGATLTNGRITIRAASTAGTSTVARILALVNSAQASKTQIQTFADKVASIFVPIIIVLAVLNFAGHLLLGLGWESALLTTIATIIIACPCAMGLATPTAITVAMGRAAKLGILFTNAAALESARNITTVIFDKTGTLTTGKPTLTDTLPLTADASPQNPAESALTLAASLEQYSEHPLALSLLDAAKKTAVPLLIPQKFSSTPGGGVTATLNNKSYALGSLTFIQSLSLDLAPIAADIEKFKNDGKTLVLLAETSATPPRLLALFAFQDALRPDARETIRLLQSRGLKVGVLSGDTELAVKGALQNTPVDFIQSNIKPEQKAAEITALKNTKHETRNTKIPHGVAFIGDGINDAPALAAADLGIAMDSATSIAKTAGDILLMSNRLATIPPIFALGRQTLRIIKQNLFWAFAYNFAAIPLAMLGILPPAAAAGAMILSSLTVVANALRLYNAGLR